MACTYKCVISKIKKHVQAGKNYRSKVIIHQNNFIIHTLFREEKISKVSHIVRSQDARKPCTSALKTPTRDVNTRVTPSPNAASEKIKKE